MGMSDKSAIGLSNWGGGPFIASIVGLRYTAEGVGSIEYAFGYLRKVGFSIGDRARLQARGMLSRRSTNNHTKLLPTIARHYGAIAPMSTLRE